MKLQHYMDISIRQKISKYSSFFYVIMLSGIFADINLSIEFDGNYYNANEWVQEESLINYDQQGTTHHVFNNLMPMEEEDWEGHQNYLHLDVKVSGDFDNEYEYADIYIESNLIGSVGNFYDEYSCNFYESYSIPSYEFNDYIVDDASLAITIDNSDFVNFNTNCNNNYHRVSIEYNQDPSFDFGEIEVGSAVSLNLIVDNFYDDYWYDGEVNMIYINVSGEEEFYCTDSESCGTHFINNSSHTANISFSPISQGYFEGLIGVYDYNSGNFQGIELSGTGVLLELLGDMNGDGGLNVYDIIILVNFIFDGSYNAIGDLNMDGILNISDIISLVNLILNP